MEIDLLKKGYFFCQPQMNEDESPQARKKIGCHNRRSIDLSGHRPSLHPSVLVNFFAVSEYCGRLTIRLDCIACRLNIKI